MFNRVEDQWSAKPLSYDHKG
jgi:hypothetical protein